MKKFHIFLVYLPLKPFCLLFLDSQKLFSHLSEALKTFHHHLHVSFGSVFCTEVNLILFNICSAEYSSYITFREMCKKNHLKHYLYEKGLRIQKELNKNLHSCYRSIKWYGGGADLILQGNWSLQTAQSFFPIGPFTEECPSAEKQSSHPVQNMPK